MSNCHRTNSKHSVVKLAQLALVAVLALAASWSINASDISYSYWNIGASVSNRDSEYLTRDMNLYLDVNFSRNIHEFVLDENYSGIHFWIDVTQSRDLSDHSSYELRLLQSLIGFGAHYSTEAFSTYFRLGRGGSAARFKSVSKSSGPGIVVTGGGSSDIFAPPRVIFSGDGGASQSSSTNSESGLVGKLGIRYRVSQKFEVGAAVLGCNIDSIGTELSVYVQRDFNGGRIRTSTLGMPSGQMSIRADVVATTNAKSAGISFAYTF